MVLGERINMNDISIIHYTANRIEEPFATNIRSHLLSWLPESTPIISVSHSPMDFGRNICMPELEYSIYSIYVQILVGCKEADTKFVMCFEDDSLLHQEHFVYRPSDDKTFAYNLHRYNVNANIFFHRNRLNMSMCIAPTALMVETLERRFEKFPKLLSNEEMGAIGGFGEPGKFEFRYGLPEVKREAFETKIPTLVFNHRPSVGGVRKVTAKDTVKEELPYWGKASDLWNRMYGT